MILWVDKSFPRCVCTRCDHPFIQYIQDPYDQTFNDTSFVCIHSRFLFKYPKRSLLCHLIPRIMPPRFLVRMRSQVAMQKQWHQDPSPDPPPYELPDPFNIPESQQRPSGQSYEAPPAYRRRQQGVLDDASTDLHSFPEHSTILVVGAFSRQGMHIIDRLLDQGYRVRGAVSDTREAAQTSKYFEARHDRDQYNSCIIPDMTLEQAFNTAVDSCSGIIFVAGNRTSAANARGPVFQKVKNVLDAAKREGKMYRFVYCTPGCGAVATVQSSDGRRDPPAYETRRNYRVNASKDSTEAAIWDWANRSQPGFALDTGECSILTVRYGILTDRSRSIAS